MYKDLHIRMFVKSYSFSANGIVWHCDLERVGIFIQGLTLDNRNFLYATFWQVFSILLSLVPLQGKIWPTVLTPPSRSTDKFNYAMTRWLAATLSYDDANMYHSTVKHRQSELPLGRNIIHQERTALKLISVSLELASSINHESSAPLLQKSRNATVNPKEWTV